MHTHIYHIYTYVYDISTYIHTNNPDWYRSYYSKSLLDARRFIYTDFMAILLGMLKMYRLLRRSIIFNIEIGFVDGAWVHDGIRVYNNIYVWIYIRNQSTIILMWYKDYL